MRLPATRLLLETYPYQCELQIRLADIDHGQHVNNAAVAAYHEESRARLHIDLMGIGSVVQRTRVGGGVVAHVSIHYLREILYGPAVTGCVAVSAFGRTSYTLGQALFQAGVCVGACDTVIAWREAGRPMPVPAALRHSLAAVLMRTAIVSRH